MRLTSKYLLSLLGFLTAFLAAGQLSACGQAPATATNTSFDRSAPAAERAKALNIQGIQLQSQGKMQAAADCYRQAIRIYPEGPAGHNNLAVVLKDLNLIPEAEKEAFIAIKLRPTRGDYHFNLGLIQQRLNKQVEAEASFRAALKQDTMNAENHFRVAQTLFAQHKAVEAEDEIKVGILLKPNEAKYHRLLADCLLQQTKHDGALCEYKTAMELSPESAESGDIKNKIEYLKQVLKLP